MLPFCLYITEYTSDPETALGTLRRFVNADPEVGGDSRNRHRRATLGHCIQYLLMSELQPGGIEVDAQHPTGVQQVQAVLRRPRERKRRLERMMKPLNPTDVESPFKVAADASKTSPKAMTFNRDVCVMTFDFKAYKTGLMKQPRTEDLV